MRNARDSRQGACAPMLYTAVKRALPKDSLPSGRVRPATMCPTRGCEVRRRRGRSSPAGRGHTWSRGAVPRAATCSSHSGEAEPSTKSKIQGRARRLRLIRKPWRTPHMHALCLGSSDLPWTCGSPDAPKIKRAFDHRALPLPAQTYGGHPSQRWAAAPWGRRRSTPPCRPCSGIRRNNSRTR